MKIILLGITLLFAGIHGYAQTATIIDENILWIPAEPETNRFTITKTEMQKVESINSEIGTIEGYNLTFKMGNILYVKDMDTNTIHPKSKELFIQSGAGAILHLRVMIKDQKSDAIIKMKYEFILTFD